MAVTKLKHISASCDGCKKEVAVFIPERQNLPDKWEHFVAKPYSCDRGCCENYEIEKDLCEVCLKKFKKKYKE